MNSLTGEVPPELGEMSQLDYLYALHLIPYRKLSTALHTSLLARHLLLKKPQHKDLDQPSRNM